MKIFRQNLKYFLILGLVLSVVFARELPTNTLSKTTDIATDPTHPAESVMNINNMAYWIVKSGGATIERSPNGTTVDYPKGTGGLVYEDGIVIGAKVTDDGSQRVRVGGDTYYHGTKAGRVLFDDSGNVIGSEDPATRHVWRVRTDYKKAETGEKDATNILAGDAANFYMTDASSVTETQLDELIADYDYDWKNWPADEGAPFEDVDGDGVYTPAVWDTSTKAWDGDIPGYPGADQSIWLVANDIPLIGTIGDTINFNELTYPLYGAESIGLELQITMWAYNFGSSEPLGNITFKNARLIYTGLPGGPSDAKLDTVYITQWSDPDLGTYTDDYVGCDVDLSLGYVYNGNSKDGVFNGIFGLPVPAGGYDFLQGPIIPDSAGTSTDTLGMTSFTYFGAGSSISDPDLDDYKGSLQFFNLMEGYLPRPEYPVQSPWTDLSTGEETKFVLSGDPVTGTGWIDGVQLPPGDRRLVMTSGPFEMALGDTQDIVLALIGGHGQDNISSVTVLKFHDTFAQYAYDNDFQLPSTPTTPQVQFTELDEEVLLDWGYDLDAVSATEDVVSLGFEFEGYNIYQIPSAGSPLSVGVKIATYDRVNLVQTIFDPGVDPTTGFIVDQPKQQGTNSGISRYHLEDYDNIRKRPMSNGITYHFAVTAYSYLENNAGSPFKTLESSPAIVSVTPHDPDPGIEWSADVGSTYETTHTGSAGGDVAVNVINPNSLTGHDYQVYFDKQHYYLDTDGLWKTTNYPDSVGRSLGKTMDVSPSSVSGIAYTSPTAGTRDILFTVDVVSPDYNYAAGVLLTFPPEITIYSVTAPEGIAGMISNDGTNSVMLGDTTVDGAGDFAGGEMITVNISTPTLPLDVDYIIYDDGWAQLWCVDNCATCESYGIGVDCDGNELTALTNAVGVCTISEEAYKFKTIKHWNLKNATSNTIKLEDQYILNGVTQDVVLDGVFYPGGEDLGTDANPIVDGFQMVLNVGYAAPADYNTYTHTDVDGNEDVFSHARANAWLNYDQYGKPFEITSYPDHGWGGPPADAIQTYAEAPDGGTHGATSVDVLQLDVELRFTGERDDANAVTTAGGGTYTPIKDGTGSLAALVGARGYDIADHPDANNPGTGDPFFIRVPFEVWDTENDRQVAIVIYDRIQDPAGSDDMQPFNEDNRMYSWFLMDDYATVTGGSAIDACNSDLLTWNTIFWNCAWETGDEIFFLYDNPIQQGIDNWTFSTVAKTTDADITKDDIDKISVFPNPYYGFHVLEDSRQSKYVSFNHLPQKATIRIFNLGGVMVREIKKDDDSQFARWNLTNQYNYPVASGLYIVHVETDYGEKILKLALVQETQVLKYY